MKKIFMLSAFIFITSAFAEDRSILVQGQWSTSVPNDRGQVTFTVTMTDKDVAKVERETHRTYAQLLRSMEALKLKDHKFESTEYSLNPEYTWEKNKRVYIGHKASIGLSITTSEIKRVGEAIVAAKRAGVEEIGSLNTFLSTESKDKLYRQGLEMAMKDATLKADLLLKAADAKRGKIAQIVEASQSFSLPPMPRPMMAMAKSFRGEESAPAPSIQGGESNVSVSISAKFMIE